MARYRFTGDAPVMVPDLNRFSDNLVEPGEVIETDVAINNAYFDLVEGATEPAETPEAAAETPAPEAAPEAVAGAVEADPETPTPSPEEA